MMTYPMSKPARIGPANPRLTWSAGDMCRKARMSRDELISAARSGTFVCCFETFNRATVNGLPIFGRTPTANFPRRPGTRSDLFEQASLAAEVSQLPGVPQHDANERRTSAIYRKLGRKIPCTGFICDLFHNCCYFNNLKSFLATSLPRSAALRKSRLPSSRFLATPVPLTYSIARLVMLSGLPRSIALR
jgi:hypothetical protein